MLNSIVLAMLFLAAPADVRSLSWLSGCWVMEKSGRSIHEVWLPASDNLILGVSQTVKGGRTTEFESMRIEQRSDGSLAFVAAPSGQPQAAFRLTAHDARSVTFENAEHDFPQKISYTRSGDELTAVIEGKTDAGVKAITFSYKRAKCAE